MMIYVDENVLYFSIRSCHRYPSSTQIEVRLAAYNTAAKRTSTVPSERLLLPTARL